MTLDSPMKDNDEPDEGNKHYRPRDMTVPDRRCPLKEDTVLVIRRGRKLARAVAIRPGGSAPRDYRTGRLVRLD